MKNCKKLLKLAGAVVVFLIALLMIATVTVSVQGYQMYQSAVKEMPIADKVESIRDMENFTVYEELPEIYRNAVISAEDERFFIHNGVDWRAIGRAVLHDIQKMSFAEGGSTITQQLMKNEYFTQEKRLERKIAEMFAAWEIEKEYSKKDIFELYANTIYFGSGYYGIYDAAQGYYGKEPSELTDYEAIMLAGLPNAPSVYSPDTNPELARKRMAQVLARMEDCNVITQEDAEQLLSENK